MLSCRNLNPKKQIALTIKTILYYKYYVIVTNWLVIKLLTIIFG